MSDSMSLTCGRCSGLIPAGARFCPGCGTGVEAMNRPSGERRQLSVLFCDLVGSTALSTRLDPEEWGQVLHEFHAACQEAVGGLEGHVAQYLGDGVLVYFGYPQAHENDAERGIRGGLAILHALVGLNLRLRQQGPIELEVRVAVHTGPVVVGDVGTDGRRDTTAVGDTVNIASHLTALAAPGTLVVSAATLRLAEGLFVTEDLGPQVVKGLRNPMSMHRVLREADLATRFHAVARRGLTPLVGREHEIGVLQNRWRDVTERSGRAVEIFGEAGIGKSRVIHALREGLALKPESWLECGCFPSRQGSALHPVLSLLSRTLRLDSEPSPERRLAMLEESLAASEVPLNEAVALLAPLFSLPLPAGFAAPEIAPEARRGRTLAALAEWFRCRGWDRPTVLVIEDLHWSDPSTLEVISALLAELHRSRLLVLLTFRREFELPVGISSATTPLAILRLPPSHTMEMIRGLLGDRRISDGLLDRLVEKTEGIPLFVEELTRSVVRAPRTAASSLGSVDPEFTIPATLHDSLMSRLDRLITAKPVAQLAAVIGRHFDRRLLELASRLPPDAVECALHELLENELVGVDPDAPDPTYVFRHALIQDAAYESLLRIRRRELHGRLVMVLEDEFPQIVAQQPDLLAHHCLHARLTRKAIDYLERAADAASARYAGPEAVAHLDIAIRTVEELPDSADRLQRLHALHMRRCMILFMTSGTGDSEVMAALSTGSELAERARRPAEMHILNALLAGSHDMRAEYRSAREISERGLNLLGETIQWPGWTVPEPLVRSVYEATLSTALFFAGDFEAALDVCRDAIDRYDPNLRMPLQIGMTDPTMVAFVNGGITLWHLGWPDTALELVRRGVELVSGGGAECSQSLAHSQVFKALLFLHRRDAVRAMCVADEVVRLSTERGMRFFLNAGRAIRACALIIGGEPEAGGKELEATLTDAARSETRFAGSLWLGMLASSHLQVGRFSEAGVILRQAEAFADAFGEGFWRAELLRLDGELALILPEPDRERAERSFRQALETARAQHARSFELRAATSLANLLARDGHRDQARACLGEVLGRFEEGFDTGDLREAASLLASF